MIDIDLTFKYGTKGQVRALVNALYPQATNKEKLKIIRSIESLRRVRTMLQDTKFELNKDFS